MLFSGNLWCPYFHKYVFLDSIILCIEYVKIVCARTHKNIIISLTCLQRWSSTLMPLVTFFILMINHELSTGSRERKLSLHFLVNRTLICIVTLPMFKN